MEAALGIPSSCWLSLPGPILLGGLIQGCMGHVVKQTTDAPLKYLLFSTEFLSLLPKTDHSLLFSTLWTLAFVPA